MEEKRERGQRRWRDGEMIEIRRGEKTGRRFSGNLSNLVESRD
jgi:hypothetical protein